MRSAGARTPGLHLTGDYLRGCSIEACFAAAEQTVVHADTTSEILLHAGYSEVCLHRCDLPITIGRDIDEAIEMVMAIGPAGEILRLAGDRAAHLHEDVRGALRAGLTEFEDGDGVRAPASTWIVSARTPEH